MGSGSFFWMVVKNLDSFTPVVSLAYPMYASIKAIETKSIADGQQWLIYWILYSILTLFEYTFAPVLEWFPFWSYLKLVGSCWLVLPCFFGATYVYGQYVRPFIKNPQIPWKDILISKSDDILTAAKKCMQENGLDNLIPRADKNAWE